MQHAFVNAKVFNPYPKSYRDTPLANCYRKCELQKKRSYEERIYKVEHRSFTPLIDLLDSKWACMSKELDYNIVQI